MNFPSFCEKVSGRELGSLPGQSVCGLWVLEAMWSLYSLCESIASNDPWWLLISSRVVLCQEFCSEVVRLLFGIWHDDTNGLDENCRFSIIYTKSNSSYFFLNYTDQVQVGSAYESSPLVQMNSNKCKYNYKLIPDVNQYLYCILFTETQTLKS